MIKDGRLRRLAEAAVAGPWIECGHDRGGCSCGLIYSQPADVPVAKITIGVWGDEYPEVRVTEGENLRRRNLPPDPPTVKLEPYMAMVEYGEVPDRLGKANAAFIAAANPTAIIELLDEIDRLQHRLTELEAA